MGWSNNPAWVRNGSGTNSMGQYFSANLNTLQDHSLGNPEMTRIATASGVPWPVRTHTSTYSTIKDTTVNRASPPAVAFSVGDELSLPSMVAEYSALMDTIQADFPITPRPLKCGGATPI